MGSSELNRYLGFLDTPPLWVKKQFGLEQFNFPEVEIAQQWLPQIPEGIRLGHQMEFIFLQCIARSEKYEIIAHNEALRESGRTLGEVDFILFDRKIKEYLHVELTFKFYIIDPDISEPIHRLMGPNRRDMFFTKLDKIRNEQLGQLSTPAGLSILEKLKLFDKKIVPQVCFKAQLFLPFGAEHGHIRPLNTACIAGYWLRFDAFNSPEFKDGLYFIPYKYEWPVNPSFNESYMTHYEVLLELNIRMIKENAPLVWRKKSDSTFEKFFVVWW
ncbi:DUF1853 family protein [Lentiprolixibacter aurantiacus]|uniref:DUF1853 family protein n=1 Tax=Lentiprolixibacter aurantiacus TaxID=2993939 RepID=A0AAE3MLJ7_9FLAO|nr:DUF1853 family protein [Lentiprolixibacter aurantiacus]MCX2719556.1 DUF1853 family protein [Lentiprolixibacter aurantiacus]